MPGTGAPAPHNPRRRHPTDRIRRNHHVGHDFLTGESAVRHRTVLAFSVVTALAIASLFFGLSAVATRQPLPDPPTDNRHCDNGKAISHPSPVVAVASDEERAQ